jgi:hypothetical protein
VFGVGSFLVGFKYYIEGSGKPMIYHPNSEESRFKRIAEKVRNSFLGGFIQFSILFGPLMILGFILNFTEEYKEPLVIFIMDQGYIFFTLCILIQIAIIGFFIRKIHIKYRSKVTLSILLFSTCVFIVLRNYANAYTILHGKVGKYPIILKLNEGSDISSENGYKFIGNTKNFFFFLKASANVIIPSGTVKREYDFPE